uniref:Uncharacterized protein n=1 Tax=Oryza sativa subsp. japonica TaxID=39947 RepID=Q8S831_ORYSJ|nr:hypothetical protein [Oryza sativa Japonica Group]
MPLPPLATTAGRGTPSAAGRGCSCPPPATTRGPAGLRPATRRRPPAAAPPPSAERRPASRRPLRPRWMGRGGGGGEEEGEELEERGRGREVCHLLYTAPSLVVYSIPLVDVHRRSGEQISRTFVFDVLHREKAAIRILGSASRDCPLFDHNSSSSSSLACYVPSSTPATASTSC